MVSSLDGHRDSSAKRRWKNYSRVSFPTVPSLNVVPRSVKLIQKQYHHDILILTFSTTGFVWFNNLATGVPVKFEWKQDGASAEWFGYVSHVSRNAGKQRVQEMEVQCVGASYPLKERATRVFENMTVPEAARVVAGEFGFNFIGDPDSRRFPQLVMAGHSYWEWLQEQAKRIGFSLVIDGTNMYFREIDSIINQQITSIPKFSTGNPVSLTGTEFNDRTLDSFKVLKGDYIESTENTRTNKNSGGVDPITMLPFTSEQSPGELKDDLRTKVGDVLFKEFRADQVSNSLQHNESAARGTAKMARFNIPARIVGQGDPRVKPYAPILVAGTGTLTDGYWIVREATHLWQKIGQYEVTMTVVTDGLGKNVDTNLRSSKNGGMSTVNLQEALSRSERGGRVTGKKPTRLNRFSQEVFLGNQGFAKTPARWSSKGK